MRHQIILNNEQRNSLLNILMKMLKYHVATVSFCVHLHTSCAIAQSVVVFKQKKIYESKNLKEFMNLMNLFVSLPEASIYLFHYLLYSISIKKGDK